MSAPRKLQKALIINWHQKIGFAQGKLNATMCELAEKHFASKEMSVMRYNVEEEFVEGKGWDAQKFFDAMKCADVVFNQSPTYWMGLPWLSKRFMDEVLSAGMDGTLSTGDGRHRETPHDGYGTGGTAGKFEDGTPKPYMLSLTYNAPSGAFDRKDQYLFEGRSVDDLWFPFHANMKWMGYRQIPTSTFVCHDVYKNPNLEGPEGDFVRFQAHMAKLFP